MEQSSPEPRIIPESARYLGQHERLRTAKPSAKFLEDYRSQPDRLIEECARSLVQIKEQGQIEESAYLLEIYFRTERCNDSVSPPITRPDNSTQARLSLPSPPESLLDEQHLLSTRAPKRKRAAEPPRRRDTSTNAEPKRRKTAPGERILSTREAAARVFAKYLHAQSIDQLQDRMRDAAISINLLEREQLKILTKYPKGKDQKSKDPKISLCNDFHRWDEDQLLRAQLHFLLGRALLATFDSMVGTATRSCNYGASMYQWLFQGRDVNTLSRLSKAMMANEGSMPPNGDMVPFRDEAICELMRQVVEVSRRHSWGEEVLKRLGL